MEKEIKVMDVSALQSSDKFGVERNFYFVSLEVEGREVLLQCIQGDMYSAFCSFERFRDSRGVIYDVRPTRFSADILRMWNSQREKAVMCA